MIINKLEGLFWFGGTLDNSAQESKGKQIRYYCRNHRSKMEKLKTKKGPEAQEMIRVVTAMLFLFNNICFHISSIFFHIYF